MDPNGFDHDDGMNAFTVEKSTVIRKKGVYVGGAPAYLMSQVHKERDLFSVVVSLSLLLCPAEGRLCGICFTAYGERGVFNVEVFADRASLAKQQYVQQV